MSMYSGTRPEQRLAKFAPFWPALAAIFLHTAHSWLPWREGEGGVRRGPGCVGNTIAAGAGGPRTVEVK